MRSKFVMAEGENDLLFLRQLHYLVRNDLLFDTFNNELSDSSQSSRLTQHRVGETCEFLYKSEGGLDKLIDMFSDISVDICELPLDMILLADLDGYSYQHFLTNFNSRLSDEMEISAEIEVDEMNWNEEFVFLRCHLLVEGSKADHFKILAFHHDLEIAAEFADGDSKAEKINKLNQYIKNRNAHIIEFCDFLYESHEE